MSIEDSTPQDLHLAQWQDRIQDSIDGALSAVELAEIHAHLATCVLCATEQKRLLAMDAQMRKAFATAAILPANFDQRLFASIALLEQDKRALARHCEQQEYEAQRVQLRSRWRELVRFHLGNLIGGVVTTSAVIAALVSARPSSFKAWIATQEIAWLPHGWNAGLPLIAMLASFGIAIAAIWITRRIDRNPV